MALTSLHTEPLTDILRLIRTPQVGAVTFFTLRKRYESVAETLRALPELSLRGGRASPLMPVSITSVEQEIEKTLALGATYIPYGHPDYPPALLQIPDAPPVLIIKGHSHLLHHTKPIAMVGSRNASLGGRQMARRLAQSLGDAGCMVVSGLARGIDGEAHAGALATGTVGISGVGIDQIYPRENTDLYQQMFASGCVVTEQPIGTTANPRLFPARNRIIAGMSRGVVVVEASLKSGSLITARLAGEYGREVFAVPGSPLDARNQGSHKLIKEGATLVESAADVLAQLDHLQALGEQTHFDWMAAPMETTEPTEALRRQLHSLLSPTPVSVNALARACDCPAATIALLLVELELAGKVQRFAGNKVALVAMEETAFV
jgi:DNA processing protein